MEVVVAAAPELVRNAPEARPCIFPVQGHRKPLAEQEKEEEKEEGEEEEGEAPEPARRVVVVQVRFSVCGWV